MSFADVTGIARVGRGCAYRVDADVHAAVGAQAGGMRSGSCGISVR